MRFTDGAGTLLEEGTDVLVPLGFGQLVPGKVAKTTSGLAGPQSIPQVIVVVTLAFAAHPNGGVGGIIATPRLVQS